MKNLDEKEEWKESFCKHFDWEKDSEQIIEIEKLLQKERQKVIDAVRLEYKYENFNSTRSTRNKGYNDAVESLNEKIKEEL